MEMIFIIIIFILIGTSLSQFFSHNRDIYQTESYKNSISLNIFYTLIIIYCIVIIGFGMIYFLLSFHQLAIVDGVESSGKDLISHLLTCFYFSGVTILTIGYGDVTPVGIARFIAVIQALIGFILPTSFVLKLVYLNFEQKRDN